MFTPNVEYNKTKKKNKNVFYILLFSVFSLESASNCLKSENYKEMKKEMTSICTLFVLCCQTHDIIFFRHIKSIILLAHLSLLVFLFRAMVP